MMLNTSESTEHYPKSNQLLLHCSNTIVNRHSEPNRCKFVKKQTLLTFFFFFSERLEFNSVFIDTHYGDGWQA